jgi:prepilin-type N-terminal cleavage/methylation domain-containing protein
MKHKGFTVVELIIVIVVIGILAGITVVGYGAWRDRAAKTEVTSDLRNAALAMNNYRNFNNAYPTSLTQTGFKESPNVTVTQVSGDASSFCINARSRVKTSIVYYVNSTNQIQPVPGTCTLMAPVIAAQTLSATSAKVTWGTVPNATNYTLDWSTTSTFNSSNFTTTSNTSHTISNLNPSTQYYFKMRANTPSGYTPYSNIATTTTNGVVWTASAAYGANTCSTSCNARFEVGVNDSGTSTSDFFYLPLNVSYYCDVPSCSLSTTLNVATNGVGVSADWTNNFAAYSTSATYSTTNFGTSGVVSVLKLKIPNTLTSPFDVTITTSGSPSTVKLEPVTTKFTMTRNP